MRLYRRGGVITNSIGLKNHSVKAPERDSKIFEEEYEGLKANLEHLNEVIKKRKSDAVNKQLFKHLEFIATHLSKWSDWGGGEYNYHCKYFSIYYSPNPDYLTVKKLDNAREITLFEYNRGEICLYVPGDWENHIDSLHAKAELAIKQQKISVLKSRIDEIMTLWKISEVDL